MTKRLILSQATLLPMTESPEVVEDAAIVVEEGQIVEITRRKRYRSDKTTQVLRVHEQLVMPGLVNAHTHLYQVLLRGLWDRIPLTPWLREIYGMAHVLLPEDCYIGGLLGSCESVESGVTTVCDHFFLNRTIDHTMATIRGIQETGIRSVLARTIMDSGKLPPDCVKEEPEAALAQVGRLIHQYEGELSDGMLSLMVGPNTPPLNSSSELVKKVGDFANEHGLRTSTHVAEAKDIVEQCQAQHGQRVVEYLDSLGLVKPNALFAHCVHLSPGEIEILAARGASVGHNPVSNCMLADGIAPIAEMVTAGINVALGTDGAASNHTQDMFEVMKLTSLLQRVRTGRPEIIDPYQVLRMATVGGAKALGIDSLVGTLEPGKRADIIVIDPFRATHGVAMHNIFTHLVHTLKASDVTTTIVNGRVLMQDSVLLECEVEKTKSKAQRQAEDLRKRILSS